MGRNVLRFEGVFCYGRALSQFFKVDIDTPLAAKSVGSGKERLFLGHGLCNRSTRKTDIAMNFKSWNLLKVGMNPHLNDVDRRVPS